MIRKILWAGILGTIAMSVLIVVSPVLGFPRVPVWELLATMMGTSVSLGWVVHFSIGIILALGYYILFRKKTGGGVVRGMLYGLIPFVLAQGVSFLAPEGFVLSQEKILLMVASLIGHLVYGAVVGWVVSGR